MTDSEAPRSEASPADTRSQDDLTFVDLGLPPSLLKVLDDVGYENPSPIQAGAIPPLLAGRDLLGQAQTGTGKTAAFALPILARLGLEPDPSADAKMSRTPPKAPRALVLAPTRELAIQVAEAFQTYAAHLEGFRVLPVYGGQAYDRQLQQLRRGVHVVVGTPGRIMDHMRRGTLDLAELQTLVLDEADEMLRMGFREDVEWILEQIPGKPQIALFSATLPSEIRRIASQHMKDIEEVCVEKGSAPASTINQRYWITQGEHKLDSLTRLLEVEPFDGMIVFVRTKTATLALAEKLTARGFSAAPMNGDMVQALREQTVQKMESGNLDILVATDVAARGLDLDRISHVVNFDVPYDTDSYVHRIGRTGRAGRSGEAILFVAPRERRILQAIERATKTRIERMEMPSVAAVNDSRVARFEKQLTETLAAGEWREFHGMLERYQARHDIPGLDIAAALATMMQGDRPFLMEDRPQRPERSERFDRPGRSESFGRPPRSGGPSSDRAREAGMERYRVAVGHDHGIGPGDLVGAIAGETGIEGRRIGRIDIREDHSFVDLPVGMPPDVYEHLQGVRVRGQILGISATGSGDRGGARSESRGPERPSRPERPRGPERPERPSRPERPERPSRPERPRGTESPRGPERPRQAPSSPRRQAGGGGFAPRRRPDAAGASSPSGDEGPRKVKRPPREDGKPRVTKSRDSAPGFAAMAPKPPRSAKTSKSPKSPAEAAEGRPKKPRWSKERKRAAKKKTK